MGSSDELLMRSLEAYLMFISRGANQQEKETQNNT